VAANGNTDSSKTTWRGYNHPPSRDVKTTVTLVRGGITDEDTWRGARCKFVGSRGTEVRITEAAEHVKLRIIRYGAMEGWYGIWWPTEEEGRRFSKKVAVASASAQ